MTTAAACALQPHDYSGGENDDFRDDYGDDYGGDGAGRAGMLEVQATRLLVGGALVKYVAMRSHR